MSNGSTGFATTAVAVVLSLAAGGLAGGFIGHRMGQSSADIEQQVVARVNGEVITKAEVFERLIKLSGGKQIVERMIEEALVDQAAQEAGISVSQAEIDAEIEKIKERIGGEDRFNAALQQYNLTLEDLREDQLFRLKVTKLLAKDLPTDDETLRQYFEENIAQWDERKAHARHILVETEEEAKEILSALESGADFAELAREKSIGPSAEEGGDLGTFQRKDMVKEFSDVVFNLEPGQISQPFKTQYGWHVAQLLEIEGAPPSFEANKEQIKDMYLLDEVEARMEAWLDELKAEADITNTLAKDEQ